MEIRVSTTDAEIEACYEVMKELRPHVPRDGFVAHVRRQQRSGYHMAFVAVDAAPVAVAGYRYGENLAWGRFMYVDDLVTSGDSRSKGHGGALLAWLHDEARGNDCRQLHLDSGIQRKDTHRFYEREGMTLTSYHFTTEL